MADRRSDEDTSRRTRVRRLRQRDEILRLLAAQQLHRAADLAHEHIAEFADDDHVRACLTVAVAASADPLVRRRVREFGTQ